MVPYVRVIITACLLISCGSPEVEEDPNAHRYTLDASQYAASEDPPSLYVEYGALAVPLEAKDLILNNMDHDSLRWIATPSYCKAGQLPNELPRWISANLLEVPPVHLTSARITIASSGSETVLTPSFSLRTSDGSWLPCKVAPQVTRAANTLTASIAMDVADATILAIFLDAKTHIHNISYTTRD